MKRKKRPDDVETKEERENEPIRGKSSTALQQRRLVYTKEKEKNKSTIYTYSYII